MKKFKKLTLATVVGSLMMGASVAQAHVSYYVNGSGTNVAGDGNVAASTAANWTDGVGPTGYTGNLPVNWIAHIHNDTNPNFSLTASKADAITNEGAPSTFNLVSPNNKWGTGNGSPWGAAMNYGLIHLMGNGNLTIEVAADATQGSQFTPGFTVWQGWDTATASSKHQSWDTPTGATGKLGATGITYLGHASTTTAGGSAILTLTNLAAGDYTIWLGGNGTGGTTGTNQSYVVNFTASPVPLPGAVWLMGSGLLGLFGLRRRKTGDNA